MSNFSGVLRDRKMMEGKIKAFSSEAKASAIIVGSLPFAVTGLVYVRALPDFPALDDLDRAARSRGTGFWMAIGIFVMKKMVNFDYWRRGIFLWRTDMDDMTDFF